MCPTLSLFQANYMQFSQLTPTVLMVPLRTCPVTYLCLCHFLYKGEEKWGSISKYFYHNYYSLLLGVKVLWIFYSFLK